VIEQKPTEVTKRIAVLGNRVLTLSRFALISEEFSQ
jgi:hypothetical protein